MLFGFSLSFFSLFMFLNYFHPELCLTLIKLLLVFFKLLLVFFKLLLLHLWRHVSEHCYIWKKKLFSLTLISILKAIHGLYLCNKNSNSACHIIAVLVTFECVGIFCWQRFITIWLLLNQFSRSCYAYIRAGYLNNTFLPFFFVLSVAP